MDETEAIGPGNERSMPRSRSCSACSTSPPSPVEGKTSNTPWRGSRPAASASAMSGSTWSGSDSDSGRGRRRLPQRGRKPLAAPIDALLAPGRRRAAGMGRTARPALLARGSPATSSPACPRFNDRWARFLDDLHLDSIGPARDRWDYHNRYYLLEKELPGSVSARLAARHFTRPVSYGPLRGPPRGSSHPAHPRIEDVKDGLAYLSQRRCCRLPTS